MTRTQVGPPLRVGSFRSLIAELIELLEDKNGYS
jgi:hypothetical protein